MNVPSTPTRSTYHHGDLRNALIDAGIALSESGGPEAVSVRAAARDVGVTPTAAYRHFADRAALLHEVKLRALQMVVDTMATDMRAYPPSTDPGVDAIRRLAAMGRAYVRTGIEHPGLFRASFGGQLVMPTGPGVEVFDTLNGALDDLVAAGFMDAERRPTATVGVWSTVHGFVRLVIDGPLAALPAEQLAHVSESIHELVIRGIGRTESPLYPHIRDIIGSGVRSSKSVAAPEESAR